MKEVSRIRKPLHWLAWWKDVEGWWGMIGFSGALGAMGLLLLMVPLEPEMLRTVALLMAIAGGVWFTIATIALWRYGY